MKTLNELQPLIVQWAKDRNIHLPECAPKQRLKLIEECGELASAILKNDIDKQKDAIGDIFVVLVILAEQIGFKFYDFEFLDFCLDLEYSDKILILLDSAMGNLEFSDIKSCMGFLYEIAELDLELDLTECANIAWNEIKDRKGKTVNNIFIKD